MAKLGALIIFLYSPRLCESNESLYKANGAAVREILAMERSQFGPWVIGSARDWSVWTVAVRSGHKTNPIWTIRFGLGKRDGRQVPVGTPQLNSIARAYSLIGRQRSSVFTLNIRLLSFYLARIQVRLLSRDCPIGKPCGIVSPSHHLRSRNDGSGKNAILVILLHRGRGCRPYKGLSLLVNQPGNSKVAWYKVGMITA
jgi:hypothetical protein